MEKRENFIPDKGNLTLDPDIVPAPDNVISDGSGRGASRPDTVITRLEDLHPDLPSEPYLNNGGRGGGSGDLDSRGGRGGGSGDLDSRGGRGGGSGDSDSRGDRGGEPTITPDIFSPDPDLDPDVNLENLYSWLFSFIQNAGLTDINVNNIAGNYVRILQGIGQSVKAFFDSIGYERKDNQGAIIDIIEKTANIAQSYLDMIFTQALSYQTWYTQQEYNSPANQLKRLEQAGLSSSFIFGQYSNTASQAAAPGSPTPASSTMSGAGQSAVAGRVAGIQDRQQLSDTLLRAGANIGDLLEKGVSSYKSLLEADNIRQMTPIQVATSLYQFDNIGVQYDLWRANINQIESDVVSDWFKNEFSVYQQDVQNAETRVTKAQDALNNASTDTFALSMGSRYIDTETYSGYVRDKSGAKVRKDYSLDTLQKIYSQGGYDEEGNQVFTEADLKAELGNNFVSKIGAAVKAGAQGTSKSGNTFTDSKDDSRTTGHYDDKTNTITIGKQKFTRTVTRKLMNSKEYTDYMEKCRNDLIKAKDDYFLLTTGERSRMWQNFQQYLDNKAVGLKWSIINKFKSSLYNSQQPKSIVGD